MYNVHLLEWVIEHTEAAHYLALPPSPREIMRKGVFMGVGTCADFLHERRISRPSAREGV